jgi:hypothetical protein
MGKLGQKHWSIEEAKDVLGEWRASGLSAGAFAKKVGLRRNRLNWWRKRLRDWRELEPADTSLSSLKLVPLVPSEVVARPMSGTVTMRLPGSVELEFEDASQLRPEWVAAVVREVARAR